MSEAIGKKDSQDKLRLDLVPTEAIEGLSLALMNGVKKYGEHNWRLGLSYSDIYGAAQRHLQKFWNTNKPDIDKDSKLPHLYHAICNIAFLIAYEENKERYQTFDDRAGSSNSYYKEREEKIGRLLDLVQDNQKFFGCRGGDDKLDKLYDTLDYAINTPQQFPDQPDFPDLTRMTHPEACKYLKPGMKVLVLHKATNFEKGWKNTWVSSMDEYVNTVCIINRVEKTEVTMTNNIFGYPAFVLEIVDGGE